MSLVADVLLRFQSENDPHDLSAFYSLTRLTSSQKALLLPHFPAPLLPRILDLITADRNENCETERPRRTERAEMKLFGSTVVLF